VAARAPAEIELLGKSGIMRRPVRGAYHYIHDVGGRVVASSEMEDEHVRDIGEQCGSTGSSARPTDARIRTGRTVARPEG